jgi:hypothetical protein
MSLVSQSSDKPLSIPVYVIDDLIHAAIREGVPDGVGAAIAHLRLLARRQGVELPLPTR